MPGAWCCPRCRVPLPPATGGAILITCPGCRRDYDLVDGIPDLRVPTPAWVDFERDKAMARSLAARGDVSGETLAREVFEARAGWTEARVAFRIRQVLEAPTRARREIEGWLAPLLEGSGPVLEIGCGTGGVLAALPLAAQPIGIDVSMAWLVVAQRLLRERGRAIPLAAAVAEALPLADGSMRAVIALDVIEHLADVAPVLREINRVAAPRAAIAFATPNRFSLGAEPHVGVWGVGWLPRRLQAPYVQWRTGQPYEFARLLSAREAVRLVRRNTAFDVAVEAPPLPAEEIARFPPRRAALARAYNSLLRLPIVRPLFVSIGPFFHVFGRKDG